MKYSLAFLLLVLNQSFQTIFAVPTRTQSPGELPRYTNQTQQRIQLFTYEIEVIVSDQGPLPDQHGLVSIRPELQS